jgi:predicted nucleic acid-binding protein
MGKRSWCWVTRRSSFERTPRTSRPTESTAALRQRELDALPECRLDADGWDRALAVYGDLAARGGLHQRSARHQDLLIAAAAAAAGIAVLHYDEDDDRIAAVTGQPVEWLAPRGSLEASRPRRVVRQIADISRDGSNRSRIGVSCQWSC